MLRLLLPHARKRQRPTRQSGWLAQSMTQSMTQSMRNAFVLAKIAADRMKGRQARLEGGQHARCRQAWGGHADRHAKETNRHDTERGPPEQREPERSQPSLETVCVLVRCRARCWASALATSRPCVPVPADSHSGRSSSPLPKTKHVSVSWPRHRRVSPSRE